MPHAVSAPHVGGQSLSGKRPHPVSRQERLKIAIKDLQSVTAARRTADTWISAAGRRRSSWARPPKSGPTRSCILHRVPINSASSRASPFAWPGEFEREFLDELRDLPNGRWKSQSRPDLLRRSGPRGTRPNSETCRHAQAGRSALGDLPQGCPNDPRNRSARCGPRRRPQGHEGGLVLADAHGAALRDSGSCPLILRGLAGAGKSIRPPDEPTAIAKTSKPPADRCRSG